MQVCKTLNEWREVSAHYQSSLGFVPTMGTLHAGHLALLERSKQENKHTVLSIFVNPTQFNKKEDYDFYPRQTAKDLQAAEAHGADIVLIPAEQEMYPDGNIMPITNHAPIGTVMEGEYRPGHFDGMLTVIMKFLHIVNPTTIYFGEKDYQQYELVRLMVKNYFMACRVCCVDTVREPSGLALSSRLARLDNAGMEKAQAFAAVFHEGKNNPLDEIKQQLMQIPVNVEYIEKLNDRLYIAVDIDGVRLIDNVKV